MDFTIDTARVYVPDHLNVDAALSRTTHLGIGAHQDDLEILAIDGILRCFQQTDQWFTGVVVCDGRGSSRTGVYADYTDEKMRAVRGIEQQKAAYVGEYGAQVMLDFPSSQVKDGSDTAVVDDLRALLAASQPDVVYTHNLTDKHPTHIGVVARTIEAIRALPVDQRPKQVYGCEVWRDLDWMVDSDKVVFDTSQREALQIALVGVFDSQITGGKRYDLATMGRRRAHATYHESHSTDATTGLMFGMDLTPLVRDDTLDLADYVAGYIARFAGDVQSRLKGVLDDKG